jgi:hypothetical protein
MAGVSSVKDKKIKIKHKSHKKGPMVDPCPGPNKGTFSEEEYVSSEVP